MQPQFQMKHPILSSASLKLQRNYGNGKGEISNDSLSTEEVMRVAGARYIQFFTQLMYDDNYMPTHPFGFALSGLSRDEKSDVELAHLLLSSAENVGCRQYDSAGRLVLRCEWMSSARANPVQRVVFHFAQALQERIEKESAGSVKSIKGFKQNDEMIPTFLAALAERSRDCPIELFKLTAVGSSPSIEETGKKLASVAESLN
ncbi:hypothetical protein FH972_005788 [Carpinus fangiana]|uniref:Uncharacterized protein n=1 Tax=Carpinus fangiana TaxID=176857 RepID=A0A5N6QS91_9ROSI|nr:hypothetical protein FH972_005788 [Carpinus fangiana]